MRLGRRSGKQGFADGSFCLLKSFRKEDAFTENKIGSGNDQYAYALTFFYLC